MHKSFAHDCLKAYVCILYASPCAPLLVLWPGEVEGTSLAMAQGKASPVPAPAPMFRVSAVLRRYDADVPPTAVGATPSMLECTFNAFVSARIVDGRTQWMVLSAPVNNPTSGEGVDGTFQHRSHVTPSKSAFCNENVPMTRATSRVSCVFRRLPCSEYP